MKRRTSTKGQKGRRLAVSVNDLLAGPLSGTCRRVVRRGVNVRPSLAENLQHAKELRAKAKSEIQLRAIDDLISMIEQCAEVAAEDARQLDLRRSQTRELSRGTLQERIEKALRMLQSEERQVSCV